MYDLRSFIRRLDQDGELLRITREVEPRFELAAVMAAAERERKAFIIENVRGADFPVVGGTLNKVERFGLALGQDPASFGHVEFDALLEHAKVNAVDPVEVTDSEAQAIVHKGDQIDLGRLPVPTFFELDSGPFFTAAVGITRHPDSGIYNIGVYRTLVIGRDRCVINASSMSDLRQHYAAWEASGKPMPIALAIGVDPAMLTAAACKLPPDHCEYGIGGALQGRPMELTRCLTSDLLVPARAEFIIEGTVDFANRIDNLLGEFAGQYGPESAPITQVTAITHRPDAMLYSIMAGRNPEHNTLGGVAVYGVQRSVTAAIRESVPEAKRIHIILEPGFGTLAHVTISIDKTSDDQPADIIRRAFAGGGHIFPVSMITKRIIVVDDDIDVSNRDDVQWAIWNRAARAEKFMVIPDVRSWELERAAKEGQLSARIGIDATMDMADREKLVRPITPGGDSLRLEDYLAPAGKKTAA